MNVTLISCTDTKRDETAPAKDMYDESNYFCDMRAYAKARRQPWFILSAKYGLVDPDEVIEPYDAVGLSATQAETIATDLADRGVTSVHITAGKQYTDPLTPALESEGIDVVEVCRGLSIGERQQWLQRRVKELRNESLRS